MIERCLCLSLVLGKEVVSLKDVVVPGPSVDYLFRKIEPVFLRALL